MRSVRLPRQVKVALASSPLPPRRAASCTSTRRTQCFSESRGENSRCLQLTKLFPDADAAVTALFAGVEGAEAAFHKRSPFFRASVDGTGVMELAGSQRLVDDPSEDNDELIAAGYPIGGPFQLLGS